MINLLGPYYKLLKANSLFVVFILIIICVFVYMMHSLYNSSHFDDISKLADISKLDYTTDRIFYIPVIMSATTTTKKP